MTASIWKFIGGYVKIKVEGLKLLQLVNEASAQGLRLHEAQRPGYSKLVARVSYRDYLKLCALAKNKPLRIVVLAQGGLPVIAKAVRRRIAFAAGMVLCIAALYAVNLFVLDVRVTGCTNAALERHILDVASAQGLKPGAGKRDINLSRCETELLLSVHDISFAAISVSGIRATISVVEGVPEPEFVDRSKPARILAAHDGIIRSMTVYDGQPMVSEGDVVRRGQVLVEASEPIIPEGVAPVHARAEILAGVWYEGRGSAPLFPGRGLETGNVHRSTWAALGRWSVLLSGDGKPGFARYAAEGSSNSMPNVGGKGFRFVTVTFRELLPAVAEASPAAAMSAALAQAASAAMAQVPAGSTVRQQWTDYTIEDGILRARMFVETLENIAVEVPVQ